MNEEGKGGYMKLEGSLGRFFSSSLDRVVELDARRAGVRPLRHLAAWQPQAVHTLGTALPPHQPPSLLLPFLHLKRGSVSNDLNLKIGSFMLMTILNSI